MTESGEEGQGGPQPPSPPPSLLLRPEDCFFAWKHGMYTERRRARSSGPEQGHREEPEGGRIGGRQGRQIAIAR